MIYKFNIDDKIYDKLVNYSNDVSLLLYNKSLAGNIENEYDIFKYANEIEPFILQQVTKTKPLFEYFKKLHILYPKPLPLTINSLWLNRQKKHEFNPIHEHSGIFSFILFLKIPFTSGEQAQVSPGKNSNNSDRAGKLCFYYIDSEEKGGIGEKVLDVDKTWERTGLIFKSDLKHAVYPFFTEGERITVSGNLLFNTNVKQ